MKKKALYSLILLVVLSACIIIYFLPLSVSDALIDGCQISITINEFGIKDGTSNIGYDNYDSITAEQLDSIKAALDDYTYTRTLGTLFSDGSMSGLGDKLLSVIIYKDTEYVDTIAISSSGEIVVDGMNYRLKNAEKLIERIIEIVE